MMKIRGKSESPFVENQQVNKSNPKFSKKEKEQKVRTKDGKKLAESGGCAEMMATTWYVSHVSGNYCELCQFLFIP